MKIVKKYGKENIKEKIHKNKLELLIIFLFILTTIFISNITIKINIISDNSSLKSQIINELDKLDINECKIIPPNKINKTKNTILKNNKEIIEWLNIKKEGMTYIINVEEKIKKNKTDKPQYCNVIATKEGVITKVIVKEGEVIKEINDSIKKEDIIISGDIIYNEETKKQVCAEGEVYAKTWYTINITLPKYQKNKIKENEYRYNIEIKHNNKTSKIFKPRIEYSINERKKIIEIFNTKIYLTKEYKSKEEVIRNTEEELKKKANNLIQEKMKHILKDDGQIIEQKVLKKTDFNSTIYIELFIVAEEKIGKTITN